MRTRTRSNLQISDDFNVSNRFWQDWRKISSGNVVNQYNLPAVNRAITVKSDVDSIVDDPSKNKGAKYCSASTCIHRKIGGTVDSLKVLSSDDLFTTTDLQGNSAHWRVWGDYGYVYPEQVQIVWDVSDSDLIRRCQDRFYKTNDVDTLLNLVESPDFVTGVKSMYNNVNAPIVPGEKVKYLLRTRKLARFIAGGHLYYAFGIAPLISDMKKVSAATASYSSRMRKTLSNAGKATSVHLSCGGRFTGELSNENGMPPPAGYGTGPDGSSTWHTQVYPALVPKKIVSIRGIRDHKYLTPLFGELDHLASRFGSVGPASFAWERIPFSFVYDWFFDTSSVFNRLDNYLTGSRKKIQDACISYKWSAYVNAVKHPLTGYVSNFDNMTTAVNELQFYHRKPIDADQFFFGASGRFGKRQVALTASLLGQMAANLKLKR